MGIDWQMLLYPAVRHTNLIEVLLYSRKLLRKALGLSNNWIILYEQRARTRLRR